MSNTWTEDQKKAIENRSQTVMVSAAAGTGKTTTMIERVVRLIVEDNIPIERIMLLSYNKATGKELKTKLRKSLIERAKERPEYADVIRTQLENLSLADIGTIHGYCLNLVKEFFDMVDQSPDLAIIDENDSKEYKAKAMKAAMERFDNDEENKDVRDLIDRLSLREDRKFISIVNKIYDYMVVQEDREEWLKKSYKIYDEASFGESDMVKYVLDYYNGLARRFLDKVRKYENLILPADELCAKYYAKLFNYLTGIANSKTLKDLLINNKNTPRKSGKGDEILYEELKGFYEIVGKYLRGPINKLESKETSVLELRNKAAKQVETLVKATLIFQEEYDALKKEASAVDFQDILRYAWKIINSDENVREEIRSRHDYVFLDEAQDVNYLQNGLIKAIAKEDRLFIVGDVKQSIYRFQLAEPDIFLRSFGEIQEKGEGIFFKNNFRSVPAILNFVNEVFSGLMNESFGGIDYDPDHKFVIEDRVNENEVAPVTVLVPKKEKVEEKAEEEKKELSCYDLLTGELYEDENCDYTETGVILAYINEIVGKKKIKVKEDEKWVLRPVKYEDIAILYRTRPAAAQTVEAFVELGLPVNLGTFEGSVGEKELDMIMNYLFVIDNVYDDYALIASLHSYVGGMTNEELADVRRKFPAEKTFAKASMLYAAGNYKYSSKYKEFFDELDRFRKLSAYTETSEFVKTVIEESGLGTYIASGIGGLQKIAAINGYVYGFKGKVWADNLHSLVVHYRENEKPELKGASSRADGVSFVTCHETKGLEYPIVILAGLYRKPQSDGRTILVDREFGVATNYYDAENKKIVEPIDTEIINLKKSRESKEDGLRLLYVAMTRAKCALALVYDDEYEYPYMPEFGVKFGDWLNNRFEQDTDFFKKYFEYVTPVEIKTGEKNEPLDVSPLPANEKIRIKREYDYAKATKLHSKYSVSELNSGEAKLLPFSEEENKATKGTNYHLVMQYVDLFAENAEEVEKSIGALVNEGIIEEEAAKEISPEDILAFLKSDLGKAAKEGETFREKRFVLRKRACELFDDASDEYTLVQGVIDMLVVGEKTILVDFKKSRSSDEVLRERYRKQIDLYAEAVEEGLSRKVDEKYLFVFGRNKMIKM